MTMLNWQRTGGNAKVLMVVTGHSKLGDDGTETGVWLSELTHPYLMFHDSGLAVDVASPEGGDLVLDPHGREERDPDNRRFLGHKELMAKVTNMPALATLDFAAYQGVFFAGGHGALWDFPDNSTVQAVVSEIYQAGHVVTAVGQGVAALVNVVLPNGKYIVDGKKVTAFTNAQAREAGVDHFLPFRVQDKLNERGATFDERSPWEDNVVVDGQLITGQNPGSAKYASIRMVHHLKAGAAL